MPIYQLNSFTTQHLLELAGFLGASLINVWKKIGCFWKCFWWDLTLIYSALKWFFNAAVFFFHSPRKLMIDLSWLPVCVPRYQLGSFTTQHLDDWHGWPTCVDDSPAVIGKNKGLPQWVKKFYNESFFWFFWSICLRILVLIHNHRFVKTVLSGKTSFWKFFHKRRYLNQFFQKLFLDNFFKNARVETP